MWRFHNWRHMAKDRFGIWLGYHMPMWMKYWAANDLIAKASCGEYGDTLVSELPAMEVLKRTGKAMGWHGYGD